MHRFVKARIRLIALLSVSALLIITSSTLSHAATILYATGPGPGHLPIVRVTVAGGSGNDTISLMAYPRSYLGGVRVAVGDINGDGIDDIITGTASGSTHVKVIDGTRLATLGAKGSLLMSFNAYPGFVRTGVFVAAGDVNGDGRADIIVAPDAGAPPLVRVFDGKSGAIIRSFLAYGPTFTGGVTVAAGDVDGDGRADIITGSGAVAPGGHVKVFSGVSYGELQSFLSFPGFNGTVSVAGGDVNGDGHADVIVGAGPGAPGGHVKVFDGITGQQIASYFAFDPNFLGGVRVAVGDVDGDKVTDIITGAGPGGAPHVKVFRSSDLAILDSFFAYDPTFQGGVFVGGD